MRFLKYRNFIDILEEESGRPVKYKVNCGPSYVPDYNVDGLFEHVVEEVLLSEVLLDGINPHVVAGLHWIQFNPLPLSAIEFSHLFFFVCEIRKIQMGEKEMIHFLHAGTS